MTKLLLLAISVMSATKLSLLGQYGEHIILLAVILMLGPIVAQATPCNHYPNNELIRRAHSHNDYHQDNPLESAIRHGICSIEVDVFPIENELLVGHSRFELEKKRNIDDM
jgi:hypothetical protein